MTLLTIMPETDRDTVLVRTTDRAAIAGALEPFGILLDLVGTEPLAAAQGAQAVLDAHRGDVDRVSAAGPYPIVDVIAMAPDDTDPEWAAKAAAARTRFLDEHAHDEDEVRLFVDGTGCFYLHLDGRVFALVCTRGDLVTVPAGTPHWFDMGERPDFCAIRFFQADDGWVADFTGSPIASRMPSLDELTAPAGVPR